MGNKSDCFHTYCNIPRELILSWICWFEVITEHEEVQWSGKTAGTRAHTRTLPPKSCHTMYLLFSLCFSSFCHHIWCIQWICGAKSQREGYQISCFLWLNYFTIFNVQFLLWPMPMFLCVWKCTLFIFTTLIPIVFLKLHLNKETNENRPMRTKGPTRRGK